MRSGTRVLGALVGLALLTAACGSDATDAGPTADAATDTTATGPGPDGTVAGTDVPGPEGDVPERIVSLSPTHTEMLFAIGAGDLLVAVDQFSDHPAEARQLPNELSGFEPNVEAIAAYAPDLVITGGDFTGLGDQLAALDIPAWDGPAAVTIEDTYDQLGQLGAITGHDAEAAAVVAGMQARVTEIVAGLPVIERPLTFYHELDDTLYSADSTTFIGDIYSLVGLHNVADRAEGENFGFPQLNAEFLVSADPDLIFLADTKCCGVDAEAVAARPGWDTIAAVENGNVIPMDDDIASRWGPRIVDYLEAVAAAVEQAAASAS